MKSWRINLMTTAIALIMAALLVAAGDDKAKDKEECTEQLMSMATCLPYVQGQAKSPTPDCCSGLKQVLNSDKKCLCVIIQDRNDPDLGLQINVSLALALPSVCHATADVTKCPALLHLDPNSPDAQVFYQLANGLNKTGPASAPTGSAPAPSSVSPTAGFGNNSGRSTNHAQSLLCKQWLGLGVVAHFFIIFMFFL
ncbi:Non-specific lipid transfer protein GPI-anchored 14 [Cardamine amara subsp. amara]|uniref:Non-specific lipid transfer protein GPI-anchored 14 n=1 Tax=Cardamine amara subsp. amara TaxID=228776 RepID=A0ABD0ZBL7_CARAN